MSLLISKPRSMTMEMYCFYKLDGLLEGEGEWVEMTKERMLMGRFR